MTEVERIAVHLDNLAEVGRLADAEAVRTRCGALRENPAARVGRSVRPSADDGLRGARRCGRPTSPRAVPRCSCGRWARSRRSWSRSAGCTTLLRLSSRLSGLGRADGELGTALGVGGVAGRASGRAFDVRTVFSPAVCGVGPATRHPHRGRRRCPAASADFRDRGEPAPGRRGAGRSAGWTGDASPCRRSAAKESAVPNQSAATCGTGCGSITGRSPPCSSVIPAGRCGRWPNVCWKTPRPTMPT